MNRNEPIPIIGAISLDTKIIQEYISSMKNFNIEESRLLQNYTIENTKLSIKYHIKNHGKTRKKTRI